MALEPFYYNKVRVIDIDGTVIKKRSDEIWFSEPAVALPGAVAMVRKWYDNKDLVIFCTARTNQYRQETIDELDSLGFKYHMLIMDKPYSHLIYIYDDNPVISIRIDRDKGLGAIDPQDPEPKS